MGAPSVFQQATPAQIVASVNNNTYNDIYQGLTNLSLIWNFTLDVAASTTDISNGANNSVWGEYRANWSFNGTGAVEGPNTVWRWTGDGAYTNGDASWAALAAPTQEDYGGQVFNDAGFNNQSFAPPG